MGISFLYPQALLLLALISIIFGATLKPGSRRDLGRRNYLVNLLLRSLIYSCLIFSLSGTQLLVPSDRVAVVFLVDTSASLGSAAKENSLRFARQAISSMREANVAGLVAFGQHPQVERLPNGDRSLPDFVSKPESGYTNIAEAVRLGLGLLPKGMQRRLVLISDGNQNLEDVRQSAQIAASQGVQIDVLPLTPTYGPDVSVASINLNSNLHQGEQTDLTINLYSNFTGNGNLQILQDGTLLSEEQVNFSIGNNLFHKQVKVDKAGITEYSARIISTRDSIAENNSAKSLIFVKSKPRVLLVEGHPDQNESYNLSEALKAAEIDLTVISPGKFPSWDQLSNYDSVILQDVPTSSLQPINLINLETFVHDLGRGLVVVGGEESYGLGGYFRTPLEKMLPVSLELPSRKDIPRIGLVLVIDRSGSMSESYAKANATDETTTKMEMAKSAAYLAATQLSNFDLLGIVTFDTQAQWQVKVSPVGQAVNLQSTIGRIQPGGGTSILNGLSLGIEGLKEVKAQVKHILLLTDGQDRDYSHFSELISDATRSGITISSVGLGFDVNQNFLRSVSSQGGGQYYFADDPSSLPQIFLQESRNAARSYIVEEPFTPSQVVNSPILKGIGPLPPLSGYVGTKARTNATTVLLSSRNDPVLAQWQYGLGRVVAWTSDARARWAKSWLPWRDFARFWTQAVRWTVSENNTAGLEVQAVPKGDQIMIVADALSLQQNYLNNMEINVLAGPVGQEGSKKPVILKQTAPGHYEGYFTPDPGKGYTINIEASARKNTPNIETRGNLTGNEDSSLKISRTLGIPPQYSPEYRLEGLNTALLEDISKLTGGEILNLQNPQQVFRRSAFPTNTYYDLRPWLLLLAIILLPLDIAIRHFNPGKKHRRFKKR